MYDVQTMNVMEQIGTTIVVPYLDGLFGPNEKRIGGSVVPSDVIAGARPLSHELAQLSYHGAGNLSGFCDFAHFYAYSVCLAFY